MRSKLNSSEFKFCKNELVVEWTLLKAQSRSAKYILCSVPYLASEDVAAIPNRGRANSAV